MAKKEPKSLVDAEIRIVLPFDDSATTQAVEKAISPENRETPKGVNASSQIQGNQLLFTAKTSNRFWDLITTVEDFLEKTDLSIKTIKNLQKKQKK